MAGVRGEAILEDEAIRRRPIRNFAGIAALWLEQRIAWFHAVHPGHSFSRPRLVRGAGAGDRDKDGTWNRVTMPGDELAGNVVGIAGFRQHKGVPLNIERSRAAVRLRINSGAGAEGGNAKCNGTGAAEISGSCLLQRAATPGGTRGSGFPEQGRVDGRFRTERKVTRCAASCPDRERVRAGLSRLDVPCLRFPGRAAVARFWCCDFLQLRGVEARHHRLVKDRVDPRLTALTLLSQPRQYIRINANRR